MRRHYLVAQEVPRKPLLRGLSGVAHGAQLLRGRWLLDPLQPGSPRQVEALSGVPVGVNE